MRAFCSLGCGAFDLEFIKDTEGTNILEKVKTEFDVGRFVGSGWFAKTDIRDVTDRSRHWPGDTAHPAGRFWVSKFSNRKARETGKVASEAVKVELGKAVQQDQQDRVAILKRGAKFFVLATMAIVLHERNGKTLINKLKGEVAVSKTTLQMARTAGCSSRFVTT